MYLGYLMIIKMPQSCVCYGRTNPREKGKRLILQVAKEQILESRPEQLHMYL